MKQKDNQLIVAVDFDGTCVTHEYPKVGRSIGAEPVLKRLTSEGARLILWTMRSGMALEEAAQWFRDAQIPLWAMQRNPQQDQWTASPKAYAHLYIDDAALGAPLKTDLVTDRPYIDWERVEKILWPTEN